MDIKSEALSMLPVRVRVNSSRKLVFLTLTLASMGALTPVTIPHWETGLKDPSSAISP